MRVSQVAIKGSDDLAAELQQLHPTDKRDELLVSVENLSRTIRNIWAEAELRREASKRRRIVSKTD
jgi:hypothetical protein